MHIISAALSNIPKPPLVLGAQVESLCLRTLLVRMPVTLRHLCAANASQFLCVPPNPWVTPGHLVEELGSISLVGLSKPGCQECTYGGVWGGPHETLHGQRMHTSHLWPCLFWVSRPGSPFPQSHPQNTIVLFFLFRDRLIGTTHGPRSQHPLVCPLCSTCSVGSHSPQLS